MRILNTLNNSLARLEGFFLAFFLFLAILLAFAQVVARNLFGTGILWADAVVRMMVLWIALLGAILASYQGQHLTIEILSKFLSEKMRIKARILTNLFAAVVCWLLFEAALQFVQMEINVGSEFFKNIPNWFVEMIIPIAFALMPFHFLVSVLNDIALLRSGEHRPA